ncbi:MAG: sensor domain-containing protein [Streptosporangiaceae bacterium]|jgi:hypothetical protein
MSFRARLIATAALATSAFLLVPAAAQAAPDTQAATHPVQITGAELKTALLPASTFGSGFKAFGATNSGKSLWPTKAVKHPSAMSCINFENAGAVRYGETAVAVAVAENNSAITGTNLDSLNLLYDQSVYQFASTKAAAAFYNQAHAKYASCKSFIDKASGDPNGASTITLKSIAKTKVGTDQAFQLTQIDHEPGLGGISLKLNTLVTVKGADVFIFVNGGTANRPVPAKTMLKLISRVAALR